MSCALCNRHLFQSYYLHWAHQMSFLDHDIQSSNLVALVQRRRRRVLKRNTVERNLIIVMVVIRWAWSLASKGADTQLGGWPQGSRLAEWMFLHDMSQSNIGIPSVTENKFYCKNHFTMSKRQKKNKKNNKKRAVKKKSYVAMSEIHRRPSSFSCQSVIQM